MSARRPCRSLTMPQPSNPGRDCFAPPVSGNPVETFPCDAMWFLRDHGRQYASAALGWLHMQPNLSALGTLVDEYGLHEVNVLVFSLQMLSVGPLYFIARVRIASYIVSRFLLADYMSIPQIPLLSKTARVIDIFFTIGWIILGSFRASCSCGVTPHTLFCWVSNVMLNSRQFYLVGSFNPIIHIFHM